MAGVQVLHPTDLPLWGGRDAGHRRHLPLSAQGHCEVWMQHRAAHGKAVNQETPDALQCNPQAVLCVTCSRGLGTDAQMLQINTTKSWEVSAEDIFPFMRTWGGEGGTWWGGGCRQEQQKGEGGGRREGEIFDSLSKITQTLLPKCLHFYALKHSELWKS